MKPVITKQDAEQIRYWVTDGSLAHALEFAQPYGDEFLNLLARYNELNDSARQAVITREAQLAEINKIRMDFLAMVKEHTQDGSIPPHQDGSTEKSLPGPEQLPYLAQLEGDPFAEGFENLLLMEPEFFPVMDHYKGDKILTYYYLHEQQLMFRKALQQLSAVETDKNNFDESLIDAFKALEKQAVQFSKALKKSGNEGGALFAELSQILSDIHAAKKELARAIVAGNNSSEKNRLVDISLPQLEIALEELIDSIGEAKEAIAHFSRN